MTARDTPFLPDFFFSTITNVNFGSIWLAIRATVPAQALVDQNYTFTVNNWNPSPSGVAEITLVDGTGAGGDAPQNGRPLTAQQNAMNLVNFQPAAVAGPGYAGVALLNLGKIVSAFTNPLLQFDVTLTYDEPDFDPALSNSAVSVEVVDTVRGVSGGNVNVSRTLAVTNPSTAIDFTGTNTLWTVRIFCDLTAKNRDWADSLSFEQLFP